MVKDLLPNDDQTTAGEKDVLSCLIEDPTRSTREIAKELNSYRQKVWREKKKLEKDNVIWGYTAIIDEGKLNRVVYIVMGKLKPMTKEFVDTILNRVPSKVDKDIRLIFTYYVNGEYDFIHMYSAPNHTAARRYYDSLRVAYKDFLVEKPVIVDVNFTLIKGGKTNPEMERLYEFVPEWKLFARQLVT